ncbi:MAG: flagellar FlbD family protein [Candidatus Hydrogenedentes bacterium]|nr:flagellar FlbD family protein [Candidatus Hydrogenedentota bacterium]
MINLTRLNGTPFVLNAEVIREIEATPDTIITLTTGEKIVVGESVDAVTSAVIDYKRAIMGGYRAP